jgi:hypothetical protein
MRRSEQMPRSILAHPSARVSLCGSKTKSSMSLLGDSRLPLGQRSLMRTDNAVVCARSARTTAFAASFFEPGKQMRRRSILSGIPQNIAFPFTVQIARATKRKSDRWWTYLSAGSPTFSPRAFSKAARSRSAQRVKVRAKCKRADAGDPPGRTKDSKGVRSAFNSSIQRRRRSTCHWKMRGDSWPSPASESDMRRSAPSSTKSFCTQSSNASRPRSEARFWWCTRLCRSP